VEDITETQTLNDDTQSLDNEDPIAFLRTAVATGTPWYLAVLQTIALWRAPFEFVDDRFYRYLVGGEAFDWVLLAERLVNEIIDFIPADDYEALLFSGRLPIRLEEEEFKRLIGASKYRAHLNYLYGITAEEALQLSIENEIDKEYSSNAWGSTRHLDEMLYQRIYGKDRATLIDEFRQASGLPNSEGIAFADLKEFTYWLFKYRLASCDPARVASDTRKALATLSRIEVVRLRQGETGNRSAVLADFAYGRMPDEPQK
jgi:hypothetical protein